MPDPYVGARHASPSWAVSDIKGEALGWLLVPLLSLHRILIKGGKPRITRIRVKCHLKIPAGKRPEAARSIAVHKRKSPDARRG